MSDLTPNAFKKYSSIESFSNVWRNAQRGMFPALVTFGAKIKLHGTNGGVRIAPDGTVTAQKRTSDVTPEEDNFGFATWVHSNKERWAEIQNMYPNENKEIIVYGEWAGKGVQRNDAVSQLDGKYFFVFAVEVGEEYYTAPVIIEELVPDLDNLLVLPWAIKPSDDTKVKFDAAEGAEKFTTMINEVVEQIGKEDPFIKEVFDISDTGEGLVFTPYVIKRQSIDGNQVVESSLNRENVSYYTFKAKSEAHRVKAGKSAATVKMAVPQSVFDFVAMFVTPARVEQGITEACSGVADRKTTADFMKWIGGDIKKESVAELEDSGMEWKDVAKFVNAEAARAYLKRCEEIS